VQLARRVVEAPGARPAIGAAINGARAISRADPPQFRRDEIERLRAIDRDKRLAPAPPGPRSSQPLRIIGWAIRARCDKEAGMLPRSGEGDGSRGCGTISTPPLRSLTEKAPQCELCGRLRAVKAAGMQLIRLVD
jgi:hypothetical protein